MTETDEVEEPQIPAALVLRRTARLWDTAHHRDAYVSRGRARFDAGRGSMNDHALLRIIDFASLRGVSAKLPRPPPRRLTALTASVSWGPHIYGRRDISVPVKFEERK